MPQEPKIALVTGGAQRVGAAIVADLAAYGFAVAIHCNRSREGAQQLADQIEADGGHASVVQADLTDLEAAKALVGQVEDELGPVSLLVNNASLFQDDSADDFDMEVWEQHFRVHLKAPCLLAAKMAERLRQPDEGLVVNIIDQRVWRPTPRFFSYTLSKSALWSATQTMAQAFAPRIRVNAIGPGPTLPNERQNMTDFNAQVEALILGRGPALAEFGATIRYLWETRSITGQMIALDGGQHLAWETPDAGVAE